jgi:hypothetical protein
MGTDDTAEIPTPDGRHRRRFPKFTRREWRWIALSILAGLILGYGLWAIQHQSNQVDALAKALAAEQAAARARGEKPVAPNPTDLLNDPRFRGQAGRSIKDATADGCYILITYDDTTQQRVGPLCGAKGSPGADGSPGANGSRGPAGADGVSITGVTQDGCDLIVSFSNGTSTRTGPWCGPSGADGTDGADGKDGRSVEDVDCVGEGKDSHWVVTFRESDGSTTTKQIDKQCDVSNAPEPNPSPSPLVGG